ncbi:MAG: hypothetical protein KGZ82_10615 [Bacteroidales bacterium]|nr:hypothetical protein [Bacteroidales bacterium]
MPNTGIVNGGDIMVYINTGTTQAPTWTPVAHATEHTQSHKSNLRERVTKQTGPFKGRKAGVQEATITINALQTYDGYGFHDLLALKIASTAVTVKYSGRPTADVTAKTAEVAEVAGDKYVEGLFLIESIDRNDAVDADSTISCTLQSAGAIEIKTVSV